MPHSGFAGLDLGDVKEAVRAVAGSTDEVGGTIRFVAENGEDL